MKSDRTIRLKSVIRMFIFLIAVTTFASCASYDKIPYFQDLSRAHITTEDINNFSLHTIQPLDRIAISVTSLNQDAANVFNNNIPNAGTNSSEPVYGYTVDQNGEVMLPLVGKIKVAGLTTEQLSAQLNQQLLTYLSKPTVSVRLVNFRVAVLGDVMRPNIYTSPSERLTITEALSLAGDLNITGKRDDIILVREIDGKRMFVPIDLTSKAVFESPYFYLKSNDLIFVQPSKLKLENADPGFQKASIIISALSVVAITVSIIVYNHK